MFDKDKILGTLEVLTKAIKKLEKVEISNADVRKLARDLDNVAEEQRKGRETLRIELGSLKQLIGEIPGYIAAPRG